MQHSLTPKSFTLKNPSTLFIIRPLIVIGGEIAVPFPETTERG